MKKIGILLLALLLLPLLYAQETTTTKDFTVNPALGTKAETIANTTKQQAAYYTEKVGLWILRAQDVSLGAVSFMSLGTAGKSTHIMLAQFFFTILIFIMTYTVIGIIPFLKEYPLLTATIISILSLFYVDAAEIEGILTSYEALGFLFGTLLPVGILLGFSYKVFDNARKSTDEHSLSPFYAKLFNLVFLVFFGIFFIRFATTKEEGAYIIGRTAGGIFLIAWGILQFLLLDNISRLIDKAKISIMKTIQRERLEQKEAKQELTDKVIDMQMKEWQDLSDINKFKDDKG